jgi:hypothetical protein
MLMLPLFFLDQRYLFDTRLVLSLLNCLLVQILFELNSF